jgi:predicted nuclease with TOPRIM domain
MNEPKEPLQHRLTDLRAEFEAAQALLRDLERQRKQLEETVFRISGAIAVIEKELAEAEAPANSPTDTSPA